MYLCMHVYDDSSSRTVRLHSLPARFACDLTMASLSFHLHAPPHPHTTSTTRAPTWSPKSRGGAWRWWTPWIGLHRWRARATVELRRPGVCIAGGK